MKEKKAIQCAVEARIVPGFGESSATFVMLSSADRRRITEQPAMPSVLVGLGKHRIYFLDGSPQAADRVRRKVIHGQTFFLDEAPFFGHQNVIQCHENIAAVPRAAGEIPILCVRLAFVSPICFLKYFLSFGGAFVPAIYILFG
jgi:hypothetical protein